MCKNVSKKELLYEKRHLKHLNDLTMRYYKFCRAEIFSKEKNRLALVVRKSSCGEFPSVNSCVVSVKMLTSFEDLTGHTSGTVLHSDRRACVKVIIV